MDFSSKLTQLLPTTDTPSLDPEQPLARSYHERGGDILGIGHCFFQ